MQNMDRLDFESIPALDDFAHTAGDSALDH